MAGSGNPANAIWKAIGSGRVVLLVFIFGLNHCAFAQNDANENPPVPDQNPNPNGKLIEQFFKGLFGDQNQAIPEQPNRPIPERNGNGNPTNTGGRSMERGAPLNPKVEQLLKSAEAAAKNKDWKSTVDLYQRLLDLPEDSLSRSRDGKWKSVRQLVRERFYELPDATLTEYRTQYSGLANQYLANARRTGLTADYVGVATRFFHTDAGYEAASYLAAKHFDRSEFELAARWYSELAASPAAITHQDTWLLQAGTAFVRADDPASAAQLLNRMSQGEATLVQIGAEQYRAADWLRQIHADQQSKIPVMTEWTQFMGNAARMATVLGSEPLLSPNWMIPLTSSLSVRNIIRWLTYDLQDQQRALIPALQPLVIQGMVFYRDFRSLRCVDLATGEVRWEGVEGISPERVLGGLPSQQLDSQESWRGPVNPFQNQMDYQGISAEFSPVTGLLFRDAAYGTISSDGEQIFVVEDQGIITARQPGQNLGWDGVADAADPYGVSWKTNRLVSYDMKSGRVLWSIGGPESRESFDLPLAGTYFHGAPTVEGAELFVVVSKADEIRLWALDRKTGLPRWSQLVAFSDTKIDQDLARRWIAPNVAIGSGVVVCPTTVGWLVAIDRLRQSILWAHRYSSVNSNNQNEREGATPVLATRELNQVWYPSAPVICGSRVIYTPAEEPVLLCFSTADGRLLWQRPKDRGIYLAGVFNQLVLIVQDNAVVAYRLADGSEAWTAAFEDGVLPSGRGMIVDHHFYLPLNNGELQILHADSGKVASRAYVGSRQPPLGNLAMHGGSLVSLGLSGLTAFGQRSAVLVEIDQQLHADPLAARALLRLGEIHLLNHKYDAAIDALQKLPAEQLAGNDLARYRSALIESLTNVIQTNILEHRAQLDQLGKLAQTPTELLIYRDLLARLQSAEKNPFAAFQSLVRLADDDDDEFIVMTNDQKLSVRRRAWISGRLRDVWYATSGSDRQEIDRWVEQQVEATASQAPERCRAIAELFDFHPLSMTARLQFAQHLIDTGDLGGGRLELERLVTRDHSAVAAQAMETLSRIMQKAGLSEDAIEYSRQLAERFPGVLMSSGITAQEAADQLRSEQSNSLGLKPTKQNWLHGPLKLEQSSFSYSQPSQEVIRESDLPYFRGRNFEFFAAEQRLGIGSQKDGHFEWMIPLRSAVRLADDHYLTVSQIGHQMFFVNRGILHAISPIEKTLLWTRTLEGQPDANANLRHENRPFVNPMASLARDDQNSLSLLHRNISTGSLAVVQPEYLCLVSRRAISIVEPRTGRERWRREGLPIYAQVNGNREFLFVTTGERSEAMVFRTQDGTQVDMPNISKVLNQTLAMHGSSLVLYETAHSNQTPQSPGRRARNLKCRLRLYDPIQQATIWEREFPSNTCVSTLGENQVIASLTDGTTLQIDLATGSTKTLDSMPIEVLATKVTSLAIEKYLLADDDQIYLLMNTIDQQNSISSDSLNAIRAHGWIVCWNRWTGRYVWARQLRNQNLILDRLCAMPGLLFLSRNWSPNARLSVGTLNVQFLEKQSGQFLIDQKVPSIYSGFHALNLDQTAPSIELRSYNARLRLIPQDSAESPAVNESSP